ncbi:MAG: Ig-like domain-containing protein [Dysgonamonadaceae bacterium]|nr:Ig-like domain-containing protein [Dysgonamonadaceae bacterium]
MMKWCSPLSIIVFASCASIGNPSGGDYDVTPPVMLKSYPQPDATNYKKQKIKLLFNEYIAIEKPSEKVIITPPQKKQPIITAIGKKIQVELKDTLQENTTYTFDFTNSIVDNNERNPMENFAFAFSTGNVVDTMMVSGILLDAQNLEPVPNIMIGLNDNLSDSAFLTLPFRRTSMTNEGGMFKIRNVSPGTYRLFALKDENKNFLYDPPSEYIAFFDSLVVPSFEPAVKLDTTFVNGDSTKVDTVRQIHYNRFLPDNIVMRLFVKKFDNQYLSKHERPQDNQLILHFNSNKGLPPKITFLDADSTEIAGDPYVREISPSQTDITYWLKDTLLTHQDTLLLKTEYQATDTLYQLSPLTDTLRFVYKHKPVKPKKEKTTDKRKKDKAEKPVKPDFLSIETTARSTMDVTDTLKIVFSEPLSDFDPQTVSFQQKIDTLWEDRKLPVLSDSLNPRAFFVDYIWDYGEKYRLKIDSGAVISIYGKWNDALVQSFKYKKEEEYAHFYVTLTGSNGGGFGELLDRSEKVVRKVNLENGELAFENILPGTYYLRYTEDTNGNREWDAGDYAELRQPEKVYYNPQKFEFRKYFTHNQTWNITELTFDKQKPLEITKNKPAEKKKKTVRSGDGRSGTGTNPARFSN